MIKGEEIKKLIVNPAIAGDHHIDDLKLLIEKYSYCGSLYFIYLKAIANVKHVDFESQLKIAAAHVSDREHLYHLINSASNKDPLNEEDNLESDSNKVELTEKLSNQEKDITEEEGSIETITKINVNNEIEKLDETQLEENIQSHALNVAFEHSAKTSIRNNEREKKDTTKKVDFTQSISDVSKRSTNKNQKSYYSLFKIN